MRAICAHCKKFVVTRPRKLCFGCHAKEAIRVLYPISDSPHARRGSGIANVCLGLPPKPTLAPPGTAEKVAELALRAELGYQIFHPYDARWENDPRTIQYIAKNCRIPENGSLTSTGEAV